MLEAGHRLEPCIAKWFHDKNPLLPIYDPGEYTVIHGEQDYITSTPDRLICTRPIDGRHDRLKPGTPPLEIKCSFNYQTAKQWATQIPPAYQIQLQQQIYTLEAEHGYYAVLLEGYRFKWFRQDRNDKFIATLVKRCGEFWDMLQNRTPPPTDWHKETSKALSRYYSEPVEQSVELDHTLWDAHEKFQNARAEIAKQKKIQDENANRLKAAIGKNTVGILHDCETAYRWTKGKSRRLTLTKERQ